MKKHRRLGILFVFLILIGISSQLWFRGRPDSVAQSGPPPGSSRGPAPTAVEVVPIQNQPIQAIRTLTGTVHPFTQFTVANKTGGQLRQLQLDVGSVIKNGQQIAQMESDELNLQIQQIKADMAVIQAQLQEQQVNLEIAERELDRDATLFSNKLIPAAEFEQSKANLETSRARLNVTQAQIAQRREVLKQAEFKLSETRIIARWPGSASMVVSRKLVEAGATLAPNTPIVELIQLNPLRVLLPITEKDLGKIRPGQTLRLRADAWPERVFEGRLHQLSPTLNTQTRTAEAEVYVNNPDAALKPGMFLKADLVMERREQAQVIPEAALVKREDLPQGVFVVNADRASVRFVEIQTGIISTDHIEVLQPVLSGEVVTLGNHLLKDGAAITIRAVTP